MKKIFENIELDYGYLYPEYAEGVSFVADIEVEINEETGEKIVVGAIAREDNEIFGVKEGEWFDPGDSIDVENLE